MRIKNCLGSKAMEGKPQTCEVKDFRSNKQS